VLAVFVDFDRRAELLAEAPDTYYLTDHYADHPCVLVRLSQIDPQGTAKLAAAVMAIRI